MKRGFVWLLLVGLLSALAQGASPRVVATIGPYGLILKELLGEEVLVLVPPSANPHVYEPTPSQVRQVAQARLVVANGAGLDDWVVDKLIRPGRLETPVFRVAEAVKEAWIQTPTGPDPHVWVDPLLMAKALPRLVEALVQEDPARAALYRARGQRLERELRRLDEEVRTLLAERAKPGIVALRNPLRYFASRYGVPILYTVVPNPEAPEATAKAVAEGRKVAQEKGIRYLVAPLATRNQAPGLAANMGLEVVFVDVLGEQAKTYGELVRKLAEAFAQALR